MINFVTDKKVSVLRLRSAYRPSATFVVNKITKDVTLTETSYVTVAAQRNPRAQGQVTLEFTFSMIIVILLMYGIIQVMSWIATSLAERRVSSDQSLTATVAVEDWNDIYTDPSPLTQLQPEFYSPKKMNLVFNKW